MVKNFEGRKVHIERLWVLYILVPSLVYHFHNEVFSRRVRRFVEGTVIFLGFVVSFCLVEFYSRCIPVDCVIV